MERLIGFDNLEGLARVDLQRRGMDVAVDDVFRRHQDRLEAMSGARRQSKRLYATSRSAPATTSGSSTRAEKMTPSCVRPLRLRRWGAQTSYPVLMAAYDLRERGLLTIEGLREVVSYIESFLVRRQLAGIPTNALNRLFVQFVEHLPQDEGFPQALRRELSRQRRYWPADDQLREAIRTRPFYLSGAARSARLSSNDLSRATVTRSRSTSDQRPDDRARPAADAQPGLARAPCQPWPGSGRGPPGPRAHSRQPDPDRL